MLQTVKKRHRIYKLNGPHIHPHPPPPPPPAKKNPTYLKQKHYFFECVPVITRVFRSFGVFWYFYEPVTYFFMRNPYMKFQNISILGSKVMLCTGKHDERTIGQARSNMPPIFFQSWGHNKVRCMQNNNFCMYIQALLAAEVSPRYIVWLFGMRSKRPQVKTAPSQNIPKLVKTSPSAVVDWSKRPQKQAPKMAPNSTGFK